MGDSVSEQNILREIIPTHETSLMIGAQAIREKTMNRLNILKTASAIRDGRAKGAAYGFQMQILPRIAGFEASFETNAKMLAPSERSQLLSTLTQMLERERRKCRARAGRYDAGRHIGLYMAVKYLASNKSPGA